MLEKIRIGLVVWFVYFMTLMYTMSLESKQSVDYITDTFEINEGQKPVSVKGRLKANLKWRENIGTSRLDLDILDKGLTISFYETPPRAILPKNVSAM